MAQEITARTVADITLLPSDEPGYTYKLIIPVVLGTVAVLLTERSAIALASMLMDAVRQDKRQREAE